MLTHTKLKKHGVILDHLRELRKEGKSSELTINNVEVIRQADNVSLLYIRVRLFGKDLFAMVDTGATLSAISDDVINSMGWQCHLSPC